MSCRPTVRHRLKIASAAKARFEEAAPQRPPKMRMASLGRSRCCASEGDTYVATSLDVTDGLLPTIDRTKL